MLRDRRTTVLAILAVVLITLILVIDWAFALTGVTAAIIGGIFRVVLQVARP
jgi:hypothetical protein